MGRTQPLGIRGRFQSWSARNGVGQRAFVLLLAANMTACGTPIVGLHPDYPPVEMGMFSRFSKFVEVDSLQPTFRWRAFPQTKDRGADTEGTPGRVEQVTYELRVWRAVQEEGGGLVYAREGLTTPTHRIEQRLEPATHYLWTVRARFLLDGSPRATEWGLAGQPFRNEVVPNPSCFRFATPDPHHQTNSRHADSEPTNAEEGVGRR